MKQALRGRTRGLSFQFQWRDHLPENEGFHLTLLWRRGERFHTARRRLDSPGTEVCRVVPGRPRLRLLSGSGRRHGVTPTLRRSRGVPPARSAGTAAPPATT